MPQTIDAAKSGVVLNVVIRKSADGSKRVEQGNASTMPTRTYENTFALSAR